MGEAMSAKYDRMIRLELGKDVHILEFKNKKSALQFQDEILKMFNSDFAQTKATTDTKLRGAIILSNVQPPKQTG
jgi:hypothetical protein